MLTEIELVKIQLLKEIKNFEYVYDDNEKGWEYNYYDEHVKGDRKNDEPTFNPLSHIVFQSTSRQYDLYTLSNVLHIKRGFLIKENWLDLLSDFNLAPHIIYRGVKRKYKDEEFNDLVFIYFYNDFGQNIDYKSTIYWILRDGYYSRDRSKESMTDYVIEDNVRCDNFDDWREKRVKLYKEDGFLLEVKTLICPEVTEYDMFGFESFNSGIFISEKLKNALL